MEEIHEVSENVSVLRSHLGDYLSQERLRVQAGAQKFLLLLGAIPLVLLLLAAVMLIGWVLVFYGTTVVLAQALGGKTWLASLIVGGSLLVLGLLVGLFLWLWTGYRIKKAKARAKLAKAALLQSFHETQGSMKQLVSVETWAERYPIQVTGVAFMAGFTLAGPLTGRSHHPSKEHGKATDSQVADHTQLWGILINTGAEIIKDVLTPLLQGMVQGAKQKQN